MMEPIQIEVVDASDLSDVLYSFTSPAVPSEGQVITHLGDDCRLVTAVEWVIRNTNENSLSGVILTTKRIDA